MSGYTRQSSSEIIATNIIKAAPVNAEFNKIRDAFKADVAGTTGHKHDGSSDEGSYVPLIADLDANNKVAVDTSNDRVGVFVEVSSSAVEQVRFEDGLIVPVTNNDIDLGSSGSKFKNVYIDGTAYLDNISGMSAAFSGSVAFSGNVTVPTPGSSNNPATKAYVDSQLNITVSDFGIVESGTDLLINYLGSTISTVDSLGNADFTSVTTSGNLSSGGTLSVTGNSTLGGTLSVSGNSTLSGVTSVSTLSIGGTTILSSGTEINYLQGVTSNIQDQINNNSAFSATASGNISEGDPLVLNNDGTVSILQPVSTALTTISPEDNKFKIAYDEANDKYVAVYGQSGGTRAVVITPQGKSLSVGTPVVVSATDIPSVGMDVCYANGKIIFSANLNGSERVYIGTVSGTTISFGSPVSFATNAVDTKLVYDQTNDKVVIFYSDIGNSNYLTAKVGTVSGTTISFGTAAVIDSVGCLLQSAVFDSLTDQCIVIYSNTSASNQGKAAVCAVSGTTITAGTPVVFDSAVINVADAIYDTSNDKVVIIYKDSTDGKGIIGTVSGTTISFGSPVSYLTSVGIDDISCAFDSRENKASFISLVSSDIQYYIVNVSGTSISFEPAIEFTGAADFVELTYNSNLGNFVFSDNNTSSNTVENLYSISGTQAQEHRYLGLSADDYTNGNTAEIVTKGRAGATTSSSLTPAKKYYFTPQGSLTLASDSPNIYLGTSVDTSRLMVKA